MTNPIPSSRASIDYELLSHIAHEARGPYNGLIGFSDLLDSHFDSLPVERQKEYAHYVKLLASKSFFQLQTFIAWIKLVSNNFKLNNSPFFLSDALKSAIQYNANDSKSKSVEIHAPADESGKMNGDLNYIGVAIANIISYALHNIEKHSTVTLTIQPPSQQTFTLKIAFKSTSMPEEFIPFLAQTGNSPDEVPESKTGLWVTGQILKLHHSVLTVETHAENRIEILIRFNVIA